MASVGRIFREENLKKIIKNFRQKRMERKRMLKDKSLSNLERLKAQSYLDKTRKASIVKKRRRCNITGDPRSFYKRYGLSRNSLRHLISYNLIPGLKKASW